MHIQIKSLAVPVTFLVLAVSTSTLSAQTMEESSVRAAGVAPPTQVVAYGDLDLSSVEGRENLEFRLRRAAREVCQHESFRRTGSLRHYGKTRECYEQALADALGQVDSSQQVVAVTR